MPPHRLGEQENALDCGAASMVRRIERIGLLAFLLFIFYVLIKSGKFNGNKFKLSQQVHIVEHKGDHEVMEEDLSDLYDLGVGINEWSIR